MFRTVVEYPELHVVMKGQCEEYRTRVPGKTQPRGRLVLLVCAEPAFVLSFIPALLIEMSTKRTPASLRRRILAPPTG